MSGFELTKTRLSHGTWEGELTGPKGAGEPELLLMSGGTAVSRANLTQKDPNTSSWDVQIDVPRESISDGVQSFVICTANDDRPLARFAVLTDEAIDDDARVEIKLLREELDLLKRAFRRHCHES